MTPRHRATPDSPSLILITGAPASGKSMLAGKISAELNLPLIAKDDVKELLADALDVSGLEWSRKLGAASFQLIDRLTVTLLERGVSLVLEANWDPAFSDQEFRAFIRERQPRVIEVFCHADGAVLLKRYQERDLLGTRHPIHSVYALDDQFAERLMHTFRQPLSLGGPVIEVDTTDFTTVDERQVLDAVRRAWESGN